MSAHQKAVKLGVSTLLALALAALFLAEPAFSASQLVVTPEQEGPVDELHSWDVSPLDDFAIRTRR